jgi:uncharacterized SAM-binding protein YcdF (DUF218 family)
MKSRERAIPVRSPSRHNGALGWFLHDSMIDMLTLFRRGPWRYLRDRDVLHSLVVTLVAFVASGGTLLLGYFVHVWRIAARSPRRPARPGVVLVFGRRLVDDVPEREYRQRLGRCLRLAREGLAERVLLLGGISGGQVSEAAAGADWLRARRMPEHVPMLLEQLSIDSLENLRQARILLTAEDGAPPPHETVLVSSRYHLARCMLLARRLGFEPYPVGAEPLLPRSGRYMRRMLLEAAYVMWIDVGLRWAALIGHRRMAARVR